MTPLPSPLAAVVLALGVYRLVRLIGWDAFPPIARLRWRLLKTTVDRSQTTRPTNGTVYRHGRPTLAALIECPYCLGWWLSVTVYACWLVVPDATLYFMFPWALSGAVGITARMLDP